MSIRTRFLVTALCLGTALTLPIAGELSAQSTGADRQFQAAIQKEEIDGDLKGAIALYEKIAAQAGADRATTAKALIRMAECHQKLGNAQSRKIYERVVREFADQKDATTQALARLNSLRQPAASNNVMASRLVWSGRDVTFGGTVSPDGRFLSHTDWNRGELAIYDLVTGQDRVLTQKDASQSPRDYPEESAISRDGKRIAAMWYDDRENRYDLRLVEVSNGKPAAPKILLRNDDITWIAPYDWSPDGAWIAVQLQRKDRTSQIGLVSAKDGQLRVLKSVEWRGATKVLFSPDGKHLAYDLPAGESTDQRDLFLMAADASSESVLLKHPADESVLAWTPDGRHLLFFSDRSGSNGIWAVPVTKGKAQDEPVLIKPDVGNAHALGLSQSGSLFLAQRLGGQDIYIASVDFKTGAQLGAAQRPVLRFVGANRQPSFAPDGKQLAYLSRRDRSPSSSRPATPVLVIHSLESGQSRDLRPDLLQLDRLVWAPDSHSIAVLGEDRKGRRGLFRIDVQTGAVSSLVMNPNALTAMWSGDGRTIFYRHVDAVTSGITARDVASGTEREVLSAPPAGAGPQWDFLAPCLSPDGSQFAMYGKSRKSLAVVPVQGGGLQDILNLDSIGPGFTGVKLEWTADGSSVVAPRWVASGAWAQELWSLPVRGGAPVRAQLTPELSAGGFSLHPNGQQVAYTSGVERREVWVLENVLSSLSR